MATRPKARFAAFLLDRFLADNEALAGDLLEEFEVRGSRAWLWRQVIVAVGSAVLRRRGPSRPLRLSSGPLLCPSIGPATRSDCTVNMTASPLRGVGGLSLAALALLMTATVPAVWGLLLITSVTGGALGLLVAVFRRSSGHGRSTRRLCLGLSAPPTPAVGPRA
jgi:hypothetical protein